MRKMLWHFALAIFAMVSVLAAPAVNAQEIRIERLVAAPGEVDKTPSAWSHIGTDPLRVSPAVIGAVHARYTDVTEVEMLKAVAMQSRGECIKHQLKDGDVLRNGFGKGQSLLTRVAFGQKVSESDAKRRSDVCIVREDGTAVVLPHGCGNWSVARAIFTQPKPLPLESKVIYVPVQQKQNTVTVTQTPGMVTGGTVLTVGCICCGQGSVIGTPSTYTPGSVSVTTTFGS